MFDEHKALYALAEHVGGMLQARGDLLGTAESCTGGGLGWVLTAVPGSSAWFERGWVTYSNQAKQQCLKVTPETLARDGAVSAATAEAMCSGVLAHAPVTWALAVTGVAGPMGGSSEKPVGTVFIAWQCRDAAADSQKFVFAGDRDSVRKQTIEQALLGLEVRLGAAASVVPGLS
ncbi:MAG: CinA family protein [Methylococcales bacterium]|nr:CinA family protein [Methylococcales bacterium]